MIFNNFFKKLAYYAHKRGKVDLEQECMSAIKEDPFAKADFERKEKLENAQDVSNELEVEAELEQAHEEKANEEYLQEMELRAQEAIDYGPDDRNSQ